MANNFGRIIIGAAISAVLIFMWGFVFWANINSPEWAIKPVPGDQLEAVNSALKELPAGTYVSPCKGQIDGEDAEGRAVRMESGPVVMLSVDPDGAPAMDPKQLGEGFLHGLLSALAAGILLAMAAPALRSFVSRFCFVFMLGVFTTLWAQPNHTIWFFRSCGSTTWFMIYDIVAWTLAAIVLAALIRSVSGSGDGE